MAQVPSIGRKVHFFPQGDVSVTRISEDQEVDGTIVYVWPKAADAHAQMLNVYVIDHAGIGQIKTSVPLLNEGDVAPETGYYARWPNIINAQVADTAAQAPSEPAQAAPNQPETNSDDAPVLTDQIPAVPVVDATPVSTAASAEPETSAPAATAAESQPAVANAPAPATDPTEPLTCGFEFALNALKNGKAATRRGWNGRGMFVYLVPAASYKAQTGIAKKVYGEDAMVPYNAYFAIRNVNGTISTWVPSVNDCLSEDWEISE